MLITYGLLVNIMDEISIVDVPNQQVLGMRKHGTYTLIPQLLKTVYDYAISKNAEFVGHPIYICHERNVEEVMKANEEGTADIEIAVPLSKEIEGSNEIKYYVLKGGTMAKAIHRGPYDQCASTYEELYLWIQALGKTITGPTREVYLNDPSEVKEEEILTEIYAPIQ